MRTPPHSSPATQRGVVLIISLIMLAVISLLATFSLRNTASSEAVAGNVRTTLLATQAAEMALRYCERGLVYHKKGLGTFAYAIPDVMTLATPLRWSTLSNWDDAASEAFVVPLEVVNEHDVTTAAYTRSPECMIEPMQVVNAVGALTATSTYVITARGFGPEEAGASHTRPTGSEVWLQSTVELN